LKTSSALQNAMAVLRTDVPTIVEDRYMAPSIEAAAALVATGALIEAVNLPALVKGHAE
jgi:histidine ammonia-lyase